MAELKNRICEFWKNIWRRIFTMPGVQWIVAFAMSMCIWFVWFTSKKTFTNSKQLRDLRKKP